MWPLLGGLASLAGGIFQSNQNAENVQATNQANMQMQQQQEAYNTQMSNTAYQRAQADMKAAGLNPILAATNGGASTPVAPTATLTAPQSTVGNAISNSISTATALKTADATINNLVEQNAKIKADTLVSGADLTLRKQQAVTEGERTDLTAGLANEQKANVDIRRAQVADALNKEMTSKNEMKTPARSFLDQAGFAGRKSSDIISPASNLISSARSLKSLVKPSPFHSFGSRGLDERWPD